MWCPRQDACRKKIRWLENLKDLVPCQCFLSLETKKLGFLVIPQSLHASKVWIYLWETYLLGVWIKYDLPRLTGPAPNGDEFTKISSTFWWLAWAASQSPSGRYSFEVLNNQIVMVPQDRIIILGEMSKCSHTSCNQRINSKDSEYGLTSKWACW